MLLICLCLLTPVQAALVGSVWVVIGNDTASTNYPAGALVRFQNGTYSVNGRSFSWRSTPYGISSSGAGRERTDGISRPPFILLFPHAQNHVVTNGDAVRMYPFESGAGSESELVMKLGYAIESGSRDLLDSCFTAARDRSALYRTLTERGQHYRLAVKHGLSLRNIVTFTQEGRRKGMLFYTRKDFLEANFIVVGGRHYFG
ncbi:MAG: hypothetical protein AABZ39_02570 [Spirochaetota bacterium]